jgi:predicted RNA methylase
MLLKMPDPARYQIPDPSVRLTDELIMQHIGRGSRVIDLGCGDGRLMQRLSEELRCDVLGIEVDHQNITSVVQRGLILIVGCRTFRTTVLTLPSSVRLCSRSAIRVDCCQRCCEWRVELWW